MTSILKKYSKKYDFNIEKVQQKNMTSILKKYNFNIEKSMAKKYKFNIEKV